MQTTYNKYKNIKKLLTTTLGTQNDFCCKIDFRSSKLSLCFTLHCTPSLKQLWNEQ
jgi:hypothetical protein